MLRTCLLIDLTEQSMVKHLCGKFGPHWRWMLSVSVVQLNFGMKFMVLLPRSANPYYISACEPGNLRRIFGDFAIHSVMAAYFGQVLTIVRVTIFVAPSLIPGHMSFR